MTVSHHVGVQTATTLQDNTTDVGEDPKHTTTFLLKLLMMALPNCLFFFLELAEETLFPP